MELIYLGPTKTQIVVHLAAGEVLGSLGPYETPVTDYIKCEAADPNYTALLALDPTLGTVVDPGAVQGVAPPGSAGKPTVIDVPNLSGTPTVAQILTVTMGNWTGAPMGYAYAWMRDGVAIAGETAQNYTLVTADVGTSITAVVTATNASGSTVAPPSNALGPIQAAAGTSRR
jgi:hypothetical protein